MQTMGPIAGVEPKRRTEARIWSWIKKRFGLHVRFEMRGESQGE